MHNYYQIKKDVKDIIEKEMKKINEDPVLKQQMENKSKRKKSDASM